MTLLPETGDDWSDWQNDMLVAEYFEIYRKQLAGEDVVKSHRYVEVGKLIGRKPRAVENKLYNVSAVLRRLHMEIAEGLTPRYNIQQSLSDAVERYLDSHPALVFGDPTMPPVDPVEVVEVPVPDFTPAMPKLEKAVERIARKYNYAERDARNRKLGALGERLVCAREQKKLLKAGKDTLAGAVRLVAQLDGDGLGYDIRSFEISGEERWIEVKTTDGPATTDFFLSRTELDVSLKSPDRWRLHRVHLFSTTPQIFVLPPPLDNAVNLEVENWRARF